MCGMQSSLHVLLLLLHQLNHLASSASSPHTVAKSASCTCSETFRRASASEHQGTDGITEGAAYHVMHSFCPRLHPRTCISLVPDLSAWQGGNFGSCWKRQVVICKHVLQVTVGYREKTARAGGGKTEFCHSLAEKKPWISLSESLELMD